MTINMSSRKRSSSCEKKIFSWKKRKKFGGTNGRNEKDPATAYEVNQCRPATPNGLHLSFRAMRQGKRSDWYAFGSSVANDVLRHFYSRFSCLICLWDAFKPIGQQETFFLFKWDKVCLLTVLALVDCCL
jgi:hypothetical protein